MGMKQFRTSKYYVTKEGEVFKFYPAKKYKVGSIHTTKDGRFRKYTSECSIINGKDYGVDRFVKMKPTQRKTGYMCFNFWDKSVTEGKKFFNTSVHRMVAEVFLGPCPDGHEVDHIDGNKQNNSLSNLQYLTKEENIRKGHAITNTK